MFWLLSVNGALGKKDLKVNSAGGCSAKKTHDVQSPGVVCVT